jgi:hypothetical protein
MFTDSSSSVGRVSGRGGRREVRAIEFRRLTPEASGSVYARYVGRVGALAVALGVGAAVVSMPMAFADRQGSDGSTGSSSSGSADRPASSSGRGSRSGVRGGVTSPSVPAGVAVSDGVTDGSDTSAAGDVPDTSVATSSRDRAGAGSGAGRGRGSSVPVAGDSGGRSGAGGGADSTGSPRRGLGGESRGHRSPQAGRGEHQTGETHKAQDGKASPDGPKGKGSSGGQPFSGLA